MKNKDGCCKRKNVIILGAGGRDFHNFLAYYKDSPLYNVVCFTATQIPGIEKRRFPRELAGRLYRNGIPIFPEEELPGLIRRFRADEVVFSYSDVSNEYVMQMASLVESCGADFRLLGPDSTMLKSRKPVIAICAVRTGAGKSPTSRKVIEILRSKGIRPVLIRHPMPYDADLRRQAVQRFSKLTDLAKYHCTIEEMEEYEQHIKTGVVVYAGVDYAAILRQAEKEADVIIFDGGNNDFSFIRPDLLITIADARRPGHELRYYPGGINLRMADIIIINKVRTADIEAIRTIEDNIKLVNPDAAVLRADMPKSVDRPKLIRNKAVLVIEDGPTITHGGLSYGAGYLAAREHKARKIIDPRPYLKGSIREAFVKYRHIGRVLPALGYGKEQVKEMEDIINRIPCDAVVSGTPINLSRLLRINKPVANVSYRFEEIGGHVLQREILEFARKRIPRKQ